MAQPEAQLPIALAEAAEAVADTVAAAEALAEAVPAAEASAEAEAHAVAAEEVAADNTSPRMLSNKRENVKMVYAK